MRSMVTSGEGSCHLRVVRVVALPREDRGQPLAPDLLDRRQDAHLVVDEHVCVRRVSAARRRRARAPCGCR